MVLYKLRRNKKSAQMAEPILIIKLFNRILE